MMTLKSKHLLNLVDALNIKCLGLRGFEHEMQRWNALILVSVKMS